MSLNLTDSEELEADKNAILSIEEVARVTEALQRGDQLAELESRVKDIRTSAENFRRLHNIERAKEIILGLEFNQTNFENFYDIPPELLEQLSAITKVPDEMLTLAQRLKTELIAEIQEKFKEFSQEKRIFPPLEDWDVITISEKFNELINEHLFYRTFFDDPRNYRQFLDDAIARNRALKLINLYVNTLPISSPFLRPNYQTSSIRELDRRLYRMIAELTPNEAEDFTPILNKN